MTARGSLIELHGYGIVRVPWHELRRHGEIKAADVKQWPVCYGSVGIDRNRLPLYELDKVRDVWVRR